MNEWDKVKSSILWEYATREFENLTLAEQITYYGKAFFPGHNIKTIEDRLAILMQLPQSIQLITPFLTDKQIRIMELLCSRYSYAEIASEVGYAHRGNVKLSIDEIRQRIIKAIGG